MGRKEKGEEGISKRIQRSAKFECSIVQLPALATDEILMNGEYILHSMTFPVLLYAVLISFL